MRALLPALLLALASAQERDTSVYDNLIFGMGWGTFIVLVTSIVSICLCFLRGRPEIGVLLGQVFPAVVFLIFLVWPKQEVDDTPEEEEDPTHWFLAKAIICFLLILIFFVVAAGFWLVTEVMIFNQVQKMDSTTEKLAKFERKRQADVDDEAEALEGFTFEDSVDGDDSEEEEYLDDIDDSRADEMPLRT